MQTMQEEGQPSPAIDELQFPDQLISYFFQENIHEEIKQLGARHKELWQCILITNQVPNPILMPIKLL